MYSLSCRDMGTNCHFVAEAETKDELMEIISEHGKNEHNMKDEDFTPELMDQAMNSIKKI